MNKKIRVILTGGGTGGHIMPILALADELKKYNTEILYIGHKKGIENHIITQKNINFKLINAGKFRRYWSFQNFIDLFNFLIGIFQSLIIIIKFKPDVVFSKGGFVGLPVVIASWLLRKPVIIHESDYELGLANRISLRIAKKIAVSFPVNNYPFIPVSKIIYVGNPLRKEIFKASLERGRVYFHLNDKLPVLLVMGGSQGAQKINNTLKEILPDLLKRWQIIHISGQLDFNNFKKLKNSLEPSIRINYKVFNFLKEEIFDALACASLVISRAGANSIFEIAALKKPMILIPLEGHQEKNAGYFKNNQAAYIIKNNQLNAKILKEAIQKIVENQNLKLTMGQNAYNLVVLEASHILAQEIIKLVSQ